MFRHRCLTLLAATAALLAIAAFAASSAHAGGACHSGDDSDTRGTEVIMKGNCFTSSVLRIDPGATVIFRNLDPEVHTVTAVSRQWGDFNDIRPEATVSYKFDDSGIYLYFCEIHPGMVGAIVVGDGTRADDAARAAPSKIDARSSASLSGAATDNGAAPPEAPAAAAATDNDDGIGAMGSFGIVAGVTAALTVVAAGLALASRRRAKA
jgi:plastocyanin